MREAVTICLTCGCLMPNQNHGDKAHITLGRLQRAANAAGLPLMEAAFNIPRTLAVTVEPHMPDGGIDPLTDRPVLVWDMDGTLAFTAEGLCGALNAHFGTTYDPFAQGFFPGRMLWDRLPPAQGTFAHGLFREPAFLAALAPDFHALDTLRDAAAAGYECVICTERDPEMVKVTANWLGDWGAPPADVHATGFGKKPEWMAAQGFGPDHPAVLIDDSVHAEVTIPAPGVEVWAPERPWTPENPRAGVRRFSSWASARQWLGLAP